MTEELIATLSGIIPRFGERIVECQLSDDIEEVLFEEIEKLSLIQGYDLRYFERVYKLKFSKNAYILLCLLENNISTGRKNAGGSEWYFLGFKKMDDNFSKILIRPQFLSDSINEFFNSNEYKIPEFPAFCKQFYIESLNESLLHKFLTPKRIHALLPHKKLVLEVNDYDLYLKFPSVVNEDIFENLINLLSEL